MENTAVNAAKAAKDHFVAIKCIESLQGVYFKILVPLQTKKDLKYLQDTN